MHGKVTSGKKQPADCYRLRSTPPTLPTKVSFHFPATKRAAHIISSRAAYSAPLDVSYAENGAPELRNEARLHKKARPG
jgi:hypothetical protein